MLRSLSRLCLTGLILGFATDFGSRASAQPASLVKDIYPGPLGSYPGGFQELSGNAFFLASSTYAVDDLWRTDGTEAGTTRVAQTGFSAYSGLAATSRKLFWLEGPAGWPPCGGCPITWLVSSDGTQAGTGPVPVPPGLMTYFDPPVAVQEQVFFLGSLPGQVASLWRADGTVGGTRQLFPYWGSLCAFHEDVAFLVPTLDGSTELWRSDGTPQGTVLVKTTSTRVTPRCVGGPTRLGRTLIFLADDGSTGCNVWRSDGTAAGTVPLGVVGGGTDAGMNPLGSARGVLVFTNSTDVWRTDGTASGTFLLKAFTSAGFFDARGAGTREGVYFAIRKNQTNGSPDATQQLWITDGTAAGTVLLHDFKAGGEDSEISSLTTANGRLVANITQNLYPSFPTSLWTSDGTPAGTVPIQQNVSAYYGSALPLFPYRNMSLFAGTDLSGDTELWKMDGSSFAAPVRPTSLSLLSPCRVLDTRGATGFLGGPALVANAPRLFPVGDVCGIPATARAIAANVTVTGATADGILKIHPSDIGSPETSVINFRAGQTRANNATIALGPDAEFTVRFETSSPAAEVHVIVDVVGWYE